MFRLPSQHLSSPSSYLSAFAWLLHGFFCPEVGALDAEPAVVFSCRASNPGVAECSHVFDFLNFLGKKTFPFPASSPSYLLGVRCSLISLPSDPPPHYLPHHSSLSIFNWVGPPFFHGLIWSPLGTPRPPQVSKSPDHGLVLLVYFFPQFTLF